ncbi:hypothetical protein [Streptomyces sp. NRRL S-350]|uniref:hypothetical protein n=1 Tax=Streptomyces sp. NRRL S-350 TaxID=1463902 RepID=UPI00056CBA9F|nr:hypothetical protein [Streptomyces sp. NRRL S-350]
MTQPEIHPPTNPADRERELSRAALDAALGDLHGQFATTWPPFRDALRNTYRYRRVFLRSARTEYLARQRRRAAEKMRWRDRPRWLAGRLLVLAVFLTFVAAYVDLEWHGDVLAHLVVPATAGAWLLLQRLLRRSRQPTLRRLARFTGRGWFFALFLTAVIEACLWPGGILAGLLGT